MFSLSEVKLEGFNAAFKPTPIPLQRFNVLIGRNGSGKSTVLEALRWIDTAIRRDAHSNWMRPVRPQSRRCRLREWKTQALKRHTELQAQQRRKAPPILDTGMLLAVCMEPMFEVVLARNEAALRGSLLAIGRATGGAIKTFATLIERSFFPLLIRSDSFDQN